MTALQPTFIGTAKDGRTFCLVVSTDKAQLFVPDNATIYKRHHVFSIEDQDSGTRYATAIGALWISSSATEARWCGAQLEIVDVQSFTLSVNWDGSFSLSDTKAA